MDEKLTMVLTRYDAAKIMSALIYSGSYEGTRKRFDKEVASATKRWFDDHYGLNRRNEDTLRDNDERPIAS